jgi:hypothetical protein
LVGLEGEHNDSTPFCQPVSTDLRLA